MKKKRLWSANACVTQHAWRGNKGNSHSNGRECSKSYSPNNTVSTLTQLLGHCIALIDDEVLVKDLEDFATLKIGHDGLRVVEFGGLERLRRAGHNGAMGMEGGEKVGG